MADWVEGYMDWLHFEEYVTESLVTDFKKSMSELGLSRRILPAQELTAEEVAKARVLGVPEELLRGHGKRG